MNNYKFRYDCNHKKVKYKINDVVMVYWPIPKRGYTQKLLPKWKGPYQIIDQIGPYTYRVKLDSRSKQHTLVVHVQRLKLYEPWYNSSDQVNQIRTEGLSDEEYIEESDTEQQ